MGERNTSIDILKIYAMYQVVLFHVLFHCRFKKTSKPVFSGFLGTKTHFLLSKVVPTILETITCSNLAYFCSLFLLCTKTFSVMDFIKVLFPIANSLCWYIFPYIIWQVLFSLIYPTLKQIDARYYISVIFIFIVVNCFPYVGFYKYVCLGQPFTIIPFTVMGFIGSYLSYHYKETPKYKTVALFILMFYYNYILHQKPEYFQTQWRLLQLFVKTGIFHLPTIMLAVTGFYLMISVKVQWKYQTFLQRIAQCSLAVYIFHVEDPFNHYIKARSIDLNKRHGTFYIPIIMFSVCIVIASVLVDIVRQHLFNTLIFNRNYYQKFTKYLDHFLMNRPLESRSSLDSAIKETKK